MWRLFVVAGLAGLIYYLMCGSGPGSRGGARSQELVRDALTGVYFARSEGVSITRGGETLYFSSIENRDRFLTERR